MRGILTTMRVSVPKPQKPTLHFVFGTVGDVRAGRGQILVTALQAKRRLDVSEGGFRLIVSRGELLPVAQVGKAELYLLTDVEALYASRG